MLGRWKSEAYRTYIRYDNNVLATYGRQLMDAEIVDPNRVFLYEDQADNDNSVLR